VNVLLLRDVAAVLLAGGAGERLYPLTKDRAKPAVGFGAPIASSTSRCRTA
jgi:ADP-glucose pyrophosphorylase